MENKNGAIVEAKNCNDKFNDGRSEGIGETKEWLLGKTVDELTEIAVGLGLRRFVGAQLAEWIYKKRVTGFEQMTNISPKIIAQLCEKYEVGGVAPGFFQESVDGTKKYLFKALEGGDVEAVFIPDGDRATLCVSSQVGCRMGCKFCFTARMGFRANLTAGEIVGQIIRLPEFDRLSNVVLMGMGEPLDNPFIYNALECMTAQWGLAWSPTRITLSTVGVSDNVERFLKTTKVHLAVSLHNPFDDQRAKMMPVQNKFPITQFLELLKGDYFEHQRRLSFEYIMFDGLNDGKEHLDELIKLLKPLRARVNLIRFHTIPDSPFKGASEEKIAFFNKSLNDAGVLTTTRSSRGEDIFAACGMLSTVDNKTK